MPPQSRRGIARQVSLGASEWKLVDTVEVISNELPFSLHTHPRQLKVLLKLFQKLAVSKGGAFGRSPQRAKYLWAKPNTCFLIGGFYPPI